MNKHTKMALFVAPILILGGYILSDIYMESQALKDKVITLQPQGFCDVINKSCILEAGELKLNIYSEDSYTVVNANFALDRATFFIVDEQNNSTEYKMAMADNPFYWKRTTPLASLMPKVGDSTTLRIIAEIKGGKYISEFVTQRYQ